MSKSISNHTALALTPEEALEKGYQIPAGLTAPFGGAVAPTGWLLCDGSSLVRADFPALFAAIGTAHGAADGTHFNLPDTRGRFIRGVDGTAGRDPDSATRTAAATGGNTGNNVGSVQDDEFKSHSHSYQIHFAGGGGTSAAVGTTTPLTSGNTDAAGGNETRPKNVYLQTIIKY